MHYKRRKQKQINAIFCMLKEFESLASKMIPFPLNWVFLVF